MTTYYHAGGKLDWYHWRNVEARADYRNYQIPDLPRSTTRAEWKSLYPNLRRIERLRLHYNETRWLAQKHICPKCGAEISNRQYWGEGRKGSSHLKGTCKPPPAFKVPRQSWKSKLGYPYPDGFWNRLPDKAFKPIKWRYAS